MKKVLREMSGLVYLLMPVVSFWLIFGPTEEKKNSPSSTTKSHPSLLKLQTPTITELLLNASASKLLPKT